MAEGESKSQALRVVLLARQPVHDLASISPQARCVPVAGAYEAAAEILAAPTAALVLDLSLLPPRHLPLLEVARKMQVPVLACGVPPAGMTADRLAGVTFTSFANLASAIQDRLAKESPAVTSAAAPAKVEPAAAPAVPETKAESGTYVPTSPVELLTSEELKALLEKDKP